MTKAELVQKVHAKVGQGVTKAQIEVNLDAIITALINTLKSGEPVTFTGFGSFKVVSRAPRKGRNPRTGQEIDIPAGKSVRFSPGKLLKDAVTK